MTTTGRMCICSPSKPCKPIWTCAADTCCRYIGTFDLAMHAWQDPFERIMALAAQHGVQISTPQMGEPLSLNAPQPGQRWWQAQTAPEPGRARAGALTKARSGLASMRQWG